MRIPGEDRRRPTVAPRRRLRLPPEIQAYEEILERNKEKAKQLSGMLDLVRARVEWMAQYGWRMAGESQGGTAGGLRGLPYGSMPGGLPSGVSFGARFLTDSMGPLGSWVAQQMLEARAGGRSLGTGKARWPQGLMEWHQGEGGERAGLGFLGRNTCLITPGLGSWTFLAALLVPEDLDAVRAVTDARLNRFPASSFQLPASPGCGACTRCLTACPTQAFTGPHSLDARRCISYLTIENKAPIPRAFRAAIGNRIYGCDDCLAVCPWNKFAAAASEAKLAARDDLRMPALSDLLALDDAAFRVLFSGSPVKRVGRDRFIRNVLVAAGNSGDASLIPALTPLLADGRIDFVTFHQSMAYEDFVEGRQPMTGSEDEDGAVFDKSGMGSTDSDDPYEQAVAVVLRDKKASTSYIQRRLQIGYNRAASIMERMENEGIVGPANHAGKREILVESQNQHDE